MTGIPCSSMPFSYREFMSAKPIVSGGGTVEIQVAARQNAILFFHQHIRTAPPFRGGDPHLPGKGQVRTAPR